MNDVRELHGTTVLVLPPTGAPIAGDREALDLVAAAAAADAVLVAVPANRFDPRFFILSSGVAGQVLQKLVQYGVRLAVVGDVSAHLARSGALRALVHESNRGHHAWFVADLDELAVRLAG